MLAFVVAEARPLKTLADGDILVFIDVTPVLVLPTLNVGRVIVWVLAFTVTGRVVLLNDHACAILTHTFRTGSSAVSGCVLFQVVGTGSAGLVVAGPAVAVTTVVEVAAAVAAAAAAASS